MNVMKYVMLKLLVVPKDCICLKHVEHLFYPVIKIRRACKILVVGLIVVEKFINSACPIIFVSELVQLMNSIVIKLPSILNIDVSI